MQYPSTFSYNYFSAKKYFRKVSGEISQDNPSDANAYVYLCSEGNRGGVVGIAWVRGTCNTYKDGYFKSSLNEYLRNDVTSAAVS